MTYCVPIMIQAQLKNYCYLMRLHKPVGILLLLWPTLWALLIAGRHHLDLYVMVVFAIGVILMRSAGCVINDFADREFDGHVTRTRERPIVTGEVSTKEAAILFLSLCAISFLIVLTLNLFTVLLTIPGVLLAASYPFMKRITHLPQLVLGIAFSWGIPMAFAAQLSYVPSIAWLMMLANIFWTIAYDTEYAMVDREDDLKIGIRSTAILFGHTDRLMIGVLQLATLVLLIAIGIIESLNAYFYFTLAAASLLFLYQQQLIQHRQPQQCFKAFVNNNWVGMMITLGIALAVELN